MSQGILQCSVEDFQKQKYETVSMIVGELVSIDWDRLNNRRRAPSSGQKATLVIHTSSVMKTPLVKKVSSEKGTKGDWKARRWPEKGVSMATVGIESVAPYAWR
ncbi:hypothetical protein L2E82_00429 [Cichorium intybus]|uniref:Uncharacterized protein n=1 Tax=Cichorium intybus TaxID=13427 RepID=A0ACB9GYY3_CICIN|nr:hypothetical protein L2E82_00429 [Cichorium intybus]